MRFSKILPKFVISAAFALVGADLYAKELQVEVITGGDDLRGGSHFSLRLETSTGTRVFNNINRGSGIPNGARRIYKIDVPYLDSPLDLFSVEVIHHSGDCFACSYDNWNLNSIVLKTTRGYTLIHGGPHRFKGSSPVLYIPAVEF